jgi:menaquinone-dependent protoporphyrinogen IX oxidase
MKATIIYKGKYGATRQYAEWLAQELKVSVASTDEYKESDLTSSDTVILGSSVYIGQLQIKQWLKEHEQVLLNKKIFLFVVCGTPPEEKEMIQPYVNSSVPKSILQQSHIYFLHGRLIYKTLSRLDKFMLRMGAMLTRDPKTRKAMRTDYDDVKKESLMPLITELKKATRQTGVVYPE